MCSCLFQEEDTNVNCLLTHFQLRSDPQKNRITGTNMYIGQFYSAGFVNVKWERAAVNTMHILKFAGLKILTARFARAVGNKAVSLRQQKC